MVERISGKPFKIWDNDPALHAAAEQARGNGKAAENDQDILAGLEVWSASEIDWNAKLPPRPWLLGNLLCKGKVSAIAGPGGVGKTALLILMALDLVTKESRLGFFVWQRASVLIISFEENRADLQRMVQAALLHHDIDKAALGDRLHAISLLSGKYKMAVMEGGTLVAGRLVELIKALVAKLAIDVVFLDPYVKASSVNDENSNALMDQVAAMLLELADSQELAICTMRHTHKGNIEAGDADGARGASATSDAFRLNFTLLTMSKETAKGYRVDSEKERRSLIRFDTAKVNIAPTGDSKWFRLIGVPLGNEDAVYIHGDNVQTLIPWVPPDKKWPEVGDLTEIDIINKIDAGLPNGQRYSKSKTATGREAYLLVRAIVPALDDSKCQNLVESLVNAKKLVEKDYDDPIFRRKRKGLFRATEEVRQ